jgi:hypothetical protein
VKSVCGVRRRLESLLVVSDDLTMRKKCWDQTTESDERKVSNLQRMGAGYFGSSASG